MASFQKRGKKWQYTISRGKEKPIIPHLTPVPFDDYFGNWVQLCKKGLSGATLRHYKYTLERIKEHFGSKSLQEITKDDYQKFLNEFGYNKSK